jgi:hypothetical protein
MHQDQLSLFAGRRPTEPRDPNVTEPRERRRLKGQNAAILDRLRQGPATNRELVGMSLKYTSRVSDLRERGCVIHCDEDRATGLNTYRLLYAPENL